jgi:hypothetical protein
VKKPAPHEPVGLKADEIMAIQRVWDGAADPRQQRLALEAIVMVLSQTDSIGFHTGPDGPRLTDFAAGRRFVGHSIRQIVNKPLATLAERSSALKG